MRSSPKELAFVASILALTAALAFASPAENWENSCASCHGADGKAQTKQGRKLKVRDYTDAKVQAEMKDDEMLKAILEGVIENGRERMKGYKDEYSEEEAKALVEYIRKMKS
jgi:cytochrome c6